MKIITICGSLKFKNEMIEVAEKLELQENAVITPIYPTNSNKDAYTDEQLEENGHMVELPNSYYEPDAEKKSWNLGKEAHSEFKARMFRMSEERIAKMDAVLTLNFDKNGKKNYIGGATFIEIYEAFMKNKKIYLYNDIPDGMLYDEISGFSPIIINGDLDLVK